MTPRPPGARSIDEILAAVRGRLERLEPRQAYAELGEGALLVDIRPAAQRAAEGEIPDALVIERNVLEWRLDPTSPHRLPQVTGPEQQVVLFCDEGYASSLAAATLRRLGLRHATDLVGGYQAWRRSISAP